MLDPWTYVGLIVSFVIFVAILYYLLYKPVHRVMQDRRDEMERDRREVEKLRAEAQAVRDEADERTRQLEAQRKDVLEKARREGEERKEEILEKARQDTRDQTDRVRRRTAQERREALDEVTGELGGAVARVARRVLEDAGADTAGRGIRRVEELLDGMESTDREQARRAMQKDARAVRVRTADPLSEEQQARLREVIRTKLDLEDVRLEMEHDPSLLAGLQVSLGHIQLDAHWRGIIDEALRKRKGEHGGEDAAS